MKQVVTKPISADKLSRLERWTDYRARHSNIWQSVHSGRHFLRSRRATMMASGILIETTSGWMVDAPALDAVLIDLLQVTGEEKEAA